MMNGKINSSKELLYSEYTGTTVVEHVLEKLEQKSKSKEIKRFFQTKRSDALENARKLFSLFENEMNGTSRASSTDDGNGIDVVMEISENASNSNPDAWFYLSRPENETSECSEECEEDYSSFFRQKKIVGVDSDSSVTDEEEEDDEHVSFSRKCPDFFVFSDCSDSSKSELNSRESLSTEKNNSCTLPNRCDENISVSVKSESPVDVTKDSLLDLNKSKHPTMGSLEKEQLSAVNGNSLTLFDNQGRQFVSPTDSKKRKLVSIIEDNSSIENDKRNSCTKTKKKLNVIDSY